MAQTRYDLDVFMTDVVGDYADSPVKKRFGPIQLDTEEYNRLRFTLDASEEVILNSEQLRGGVNDVEFICVAPAQSLEISLADTAGELWPIKGGGLFMVHLISGRITTFQIKDISGLVNSVELFIGGRTDATA